MCVYIEREIISYSLLQNKKKPHNLYCQSQGQNAHAPVRFARARGARVGVGRGAARKWGQRTALPSLPTA